MKFSILFGFSTLSSFAWAQLSGSVGPLTNLSSKSAKQICNVLDYGAKADKSTDLGPGLIAAFNACKSGGVVVIPSGDYALATWVTLNAGSAWALQLDGTIYRTGIAGGNMIFIEHATDFELFSSTGSGAIQGNGYIFHQSGSLSGPRLLRFNHVNNFAVHDIKLVDSPAFHFSMDTCSNGEIYNMIIRGGDHGGLDGVDVWSTNIWIHDIMVTNKDECVTVKSPSTNILIENIYCNDSGGCAFGSLGTGTAISNIVYRNVYTVLANQMLMVKSNGGSGYVKNVLLENFIGHKNAYSLDIDQYWSSMDNIAGPGVQLSNLTVKNWKGTEANGDKRGPVRVICADGAPCTGIAIEDFAMWTESGSTQWYSCRSAYGNGPCLKADIPSPTSYAASTSTVKTAPSGYSAATMPYDLATGFGFTESIPIPTVWPASYYPGAPRISPYPSAVPAAVKVVALNYTSASSMVTSTSKVAVIGSVGSTISSTAVDATSKTVKAVSFYPSMTKVTATLSTVSTASPTLQSSPISVTRGIPTSTKGSTSLYALPMTSKTILATSSTVGSQNIASSSGTMPSASSINPTTLPVPPCPASNSTSAVSFTSILTGVPGKPTKFICYADS